MSTELSAAAPGVQAGHEILCSNILDGGRDVVSRWCIRGLACFRAIRPIWSSAGYTTWQPGWDQYHYDRHHVILGTVNAFAPYRLTVTRHNGNVQTIDLKNGTVIYPTGATPTPGERVGIVGYYSNGTFIANRVIIHP
jgi:hypothetical protein